MGPEEGKEVGKNEAELGFARYLRGHGYEFEYEPDLGTDKRPDYVARRAGLTVVCEVKAFEQVPALQRRLEGTSSVMAVGDDELHGPMRGAVREAAKQLKPLAARDIPLVVVLANPKGFLVQLNLEHLVEALFGNLELRGTFEPSEGRVVDGFEFAYGRNGKLRTDHAYVSAVAILNEVDLEREAWATWHAKWKEGRAPVAPTTGAMVREAQASTAAWAKYAETRDVASGIAYSLHVVTTGSAGAVALPATVFDGARDRRVDVVRIES